MCTRACGVRPKSPAPDRAAPLPLCHTAVPCPVPLPPQYYHAPLEVKSPHFPSKPGWKSLRHNIHPEKERLQVRRAQQTARLLLSRPVPGGL